MATQLRPITGNKNIDPFIRLAALGLISYAGFKLFQSLNKGAAQITSPAGTYNQVPTQGQCNLSAIKKRMIANNMDAIYNAHLGLNMWTYPNEVNVILNYDYCQLDFANSYFQTTYGESLFQNINGESDIQGVYTAALNYLTMNGFN